MERFLARLLMGEMGEVFLLASRRLEPRQLLVTRCPFRYPQLAVALRHELGAVCAN